MDDLTAAPPRAGTGLTLRPDGQNAVAGTAPAVSVEGVSKRFGEVAALTDVTLHVAPGEVLGLLGPNGAGKTTLVRILATLAEPDEGRVLVEGIDAGDDGDAVRRRIGLAGQFAAIDEMLTGRENLLLVGRLYGLASEDAARRADILLRQFELEDVADRRTGTYSGGMRRKIDLGATLMGGPSVLLLDEPTAGLDPRIRNEVWALVDHVVAMGTTVVLTSQHLDEIERLAARVVVLDRGRVVVEGTPSELKQRVGGHVLEARFATAHDVEVAAGALSGAAGPEAVVDAPRRRLTVPARGEVVDLTDAAQAFEQAHVRPTELSLRLPLLDDVFLALTGAAADAGGTESPDDDDGGRQRVPAPAALDAPGPARRGRPGRLVADIGTMTARYGRRLVRTPQLMFFGIVQPVLFVVGLTAVFGGLVERFLGGDYIQYLLPGVLVMNLILAAGSTGIAVADDLKAGVIDRFRSLPMSRVAVFAGRTLTDLLRNAVSMAIMVAAGFLMGYRLEASPWWGLAAFALALLFSYGWNWLFAWVGIVVRDPAAVQFAGFAPILPLVYLSGAWVPISAMTPAVRPFARDQPVNVAIEAVRSLAAGHPHASSIGPALAWSVGFIAVFSVLATRRYQRPG
jgi:ABC transporter DrrB family efflux protein